MYETGAEQSVYLLTRLRFLISRPHLAITGSCNVIFRLAIIHYELRPYPIRHLTY